MKDGLGFWPPHRPAEMWAWRGVAWSRGHVADTRAALHQDQENINTVMEMEAFDPVHCFSVTVWAVFAVCVKVKVRYVHNGM